MRPDASTAQSMINNVRMSSLVVRGLFFPVNDLPVFTFYIVQRMKATVEVRKALQSKLEEMIQNEEPVKEVSHVDVM